MTELVQQWICIKFCIKLEHSSTETIQKAFRDDAMSAVQIKVWHKDFKDGRESVESDSHSGGPATSRTPGNVECLWAAINKDGWLTVRIWGFQKLPCPQLWAIGDWQLHHNTSSHASQLMQFFCKTSNHLCDSAPLQPRYGALWFLAFPKTKITSEREEISVYRRDSKKFRHRAADDDSNNRFCRVF